jgi:predicted Fe-S protein YdhL (DUF1289 family)
MKTETPCIGVCYIEPKHSMCTGCGRTLREIAKWSKMTSDERLALMATLHERMHAAGMVPPDVTPLK